MANPLDEMLRTHVAPVLTGAGYRRSGRVYRFAAPNGDLAVIEFPARVLSRDYVDFAVTTGVAPTPAVDWIRRKAETMDSQAPGLECRLIRVDLTPPRRWWRGVGTPDMDQHWGFKKDDGGDQCGIELAGLLADQVVPTLRRLLDRQELLAEVRNPRLGDKASLNFGKELAEIVMLVDHGPTPDLEELLESREAANPQDELASWARRRLASRAAAG